MPPLLRAATAAAALFLAVPAVPPAHAAACAARVATLSDGWNVSQPQFAAGGAKITALALAPRHPDTMLVTNGAAIERTADGGCSWLDTKLPAADLVGTLLTAAGGSRYVADIEVAPVRKGVEPVWVLAQEKGAVEHPAVFRSVDGGATWTGAATVGLPPGHGVLLAVAPDPQIAYAVVDLPSPGGRRLFATKDGGGTWVPADPSGGEFAYDGLLVDTLAPTRLWTWRGSTLAQSFDSGATFTPAKLPVALPIRDVAVGQAPRGSRVAVLADGGVLLRTDNGGVTWSREGVDPGADSVSAAPDLDVAAVAGPGRVTILPSIFTTIDASPTRGEGDPLDLAIGLLPRSQVRLAGRAETTVLVHEGTVVSLPGTDFGLNAPSLVIPIRPALVPEQFRVTLKPGQTKDVDYELDLPADPSPIDVFFLIDTTGSMGGVIDGLRAGLADIVNQLGAAGIPAKFGVGEVKDYPFDPWSTEPDLPYRLFRKVGPVNDELRDALQQLQASGGGDGPEAMTTGLFQMATGVGQRVNGKVMVPRGDDAGFRPGVLHIAVAATDAPYHREGDYPGPPIPAVHAALRAANVNVMGLASGSDGRPDLESTAKATHTLAPAGGVDCDGDGKPDLDPGDPLVCDISGGTGTNVSIDVGGIKVDTGGTNGIASAIIALLRGIKDPALLGLTSSAPDVVKVVGAGTLPVDLKVPHRARYRVHLSCPAKRYGSTVDATLTGNAATRTVATGTVAVTCLAPHKPQKPVEEFFPLLPPRPPVAAAAAPPAPLPAPVQNLNPNPNANPNTSAQLQAGAAQQRQEQAQLALATGTFEPDADVELAMSDYRRMAPMAPYGAAALMFGTAAAYGVQLRRRVRVARVRVRS